MGHGQRGKPRAPGPPPGRAARRAAAEGAPPLSLPPTACRLEPLDAYRWRLPRQGAMLADAVLFSSAELIAPLVDDPCLAQLAHVAMLPGLVGTSLGMPDLHWGYGFPIGGVAAFDVATGVVSPGGVGFDINCGVRLLSTNLTVSEVRPRLDPLLDALQRLIPSGLGMGRADLSLTASELRRLLAEGARWVVAHGLGEETDLERTESRGCLPEADPDRVSERAIARGLAQLGTLGSGNHFCEVGFVEELLEPRAGALLGLQPGGVTVILHTGSRGLGYQVCTDSLTAMGPAVLRHGIKVPDRQLACAPVESSEGRAYLGAMAAAANFAYANRQALTGWVRRAFEQGLQLKPSDHRIRVVYDVSHNLARVETHVVDGSSRRLCVHRKGATRALPPGHPELPPVYRPLGQPVLIPGDLGRASYVLLGSPGAAAQTWASVCHGAGRRLSRGAAKQQASGRDLFAELAAAGVRVRVPGREALAEEMPEAYKDVDAVVQAVAGAGLARIVARLRPLGVLKG
ncbi:MAG: RtcB family protein [Myxococcota bacterium]|nr:RtcB family protein [Myxococcota bacterium]